MRVIGGWLAAALAAVLATSDATGAAGAAGNRERAREERGKALECRRGKDWACFLEHARAAFELDPDDALLLYILAAAEARTGDAAGAAKHLGRLLDRKIGWDRGDDLAEILDRPETQPALRRLAALRAPVSHSTPGFRLEEKDLVPEGIAYDPKTRAFFVSSVHHRKIVRRGADGRVSDFVPEARDGLEAVLALRADPRRGMLWAGAAALPEMRGWTEAADGSSSLWAFDLATGRFLRRVTLAAGNENGEKQKHALNDLAIAENGDVYATDSLGSGVYRLRAGADALETVVPPGVFRSPQGIGFTRDGRSAYVAEWGEGIWILDLTTGRREPLSGPEDVPLSGVDGLVVRGDELVVTQNGISPKRVARLWLDAAGRRVLRGEVLEMNTPDLSEPTLGVLVGDDFYYVANSQWDAFDPGKKAFSAEKLQEPRILKVRLGKR